MREIRLTGKYAVGANAVALVDDQDFERLNAHAWKAKPSSAGTQVYAVRNRQVEGRNVTVRMHREVLGYTGDMEVRFWNGNRLDNQRRNLLVVPRGTAVNNPAAPIKRGASPRDPASPRVRAPTPPRTRLTARCAVCAGEFEQLRCTHVHCSDRCRSIANHPTLSPQPCAECGVLFQPHQQRQLTCSQLCRRALRRKRRNSPGPSDVDPGYGCEAARIRSSSDGPSGVSK